MSKKIVFMGTPDFAVKTLEVLSKSDYQVECVYTQPPKKTSRGQKIKPSPVQILAESLNLKIKSPVNFNNDEEYEYLKSINPYIIIVVAYGQIIPKKFLNLPTKGYINIHASLLPKWRGAAPIQRSIMNGDKETGISFMKIEEGLDTGPYLKQIKVIINKETTTQSLSDTLAKLGAENIINCIKSIEENKVKFVKQDVTQVTYAKKISKSESKINWNESAKDIVSKIQALNPSPGAWFEYMGIRYKIWKAEVSNLSGNLGEIIHESLIIGCKKNSLKILEIQKEGKNRLLVEDFLAGAKFLKGDKII